VTGPLTPTPACGRFYTTSSCGVCGKGALEEVAVLSAPVSDAPTIPRALAAELPSRLEQPGFARTGGLQRHGLFDATGELLCTREDVGRHNAMDKVIGWRSPTGAAAVGPHPVRQRRLSFELVQKAAVAGAPILIGWALRARWRSNWPGTAG